MSSIDRRGRDTRREDVESHSTLRLEGSSTQSCISPSIQRVLRKDYVSAEQHTLTKDDLVGCCYIDVSSLAAQVKSGHIRTEIQDCRLKNSRLTVLI